MILLTIFLLVGLILGIKYFKKEGSGATFGAVVGTMIGVVIFAVGINAIALIFQTDQEIEYDRVNIVSLTNKQATEGNFFLVSGTINSVPYYFFYYEMPNGGKKLAKLDSDIVVIYEEKRKDAYLIKTGKEKVLGKWFWYLTKGLPISTSTKFIGYSIHVPENSVKKEINLDIREI